MSIDVNTVGILLRREIEARLAGPLIQAFGEELGQAKTIGILETTIRDLARTAGRDLAARFGGNGLSEFERSLELWTRDDALAIDILERSPERFHFNVTRCRYAEMYRALNMPALGGVLSCARDFALIEGFNPGIRLTRSQTIMAGASYCDFRYQVKSGPKP